VSEQKPKQKLDHITAKPFVDDNEILNSRFWGSVHTRKRNFNSTEHHISPAGKYCDKPFTWLEFNGHGRAFMCCPTWLPYSVGDVSVDSISSIWNGVRAKMIRRSIFDGSYKYCNVPLCPDIQSNILPELSTIDQSQRWTVDPTGFPKHIIFSTDESCNLSCPSCRIGKVLHADGPEYERRKRLDDKIWDEILAQPLDIDLTIHITGSGDPFGSKVFRERLLGLDLTERPNIKIVLKTNGVMLTPKIWGQLHRIHRNITAINISFDAATEKTYNLIRRGGHWPTLLENVRHLDPLAKELGIRLFYDYVVQFSNSAELLPFCKLIAEISPSYQHVQFTRISDWGTWPRPQFEHEAIWMATHPHHENWLMHISDPEFNKYRVHWSNNSQFRRQAIEKYGPRSNI